MYYLQSRYYDPDTGRFINADDVAFLGVTGTVLSCNLFAYCENNPVNCVDPSGYLGVTGWLIISFAVVGGIYQLVHYFTHTPKGKRTFVKFLLNFLIGAVAGGIVGLIASGKEGLVNGIAGALGAVMMYAAEVWRGHKSFSVLTFTRKAITGFAAGAINGSVGSFIVNKLKVGADLLKTIVAAINGFIGGIIGYW